MPTLARPLTKRVVDATVAVDKPVILWDGGDGAVKGFGVLARPSGRKTFVYQYDDAAGRSRRVQLGAYGPITVDQARAAASELHHAVRAARRDPNAPDPATARQRAKRRDVDALTAPTVADLAAHYIADRRAAGKRPNTLAQYEGMAREIIGPAFGGRKVADVTRRDVAALHAARRSTPYMANRIVTVLRAMFHHAEREGWRTPHTNPCDGIAKNAEHSRARAVTADEYAALGSALARIGREGFPRAPDTPAPRGEVLDVLTPLQRRTLALYRFLAVAGWRESEGRSLRWTDVDWTGRVAELADTKTGRSTRVLGVAAVAILEAVRTMPADAAWSGSAYIFPGTARKAAGSFRSNVRPMWARVRKLAGVALRLHDLRHGFVTVARELGYGDHVIAALVGHTVRGGMTSRYGTVPDQITRRAADEIAAAIATRMARDAAPG